MTVKTPYSLILLITTFFAIYLASCTYSSSKPQWISDWLNDPGCYPPCWNNLTPGITTMRDAVDVIKKDSRNYNFYSTPNSFSWEFSDGDSVELRVVDNSNEAVKLITVSLLGRHLLPIDKIINIYGTPHHVQIAFGLCEAGCSLYLVYPELNMIVATPTPILDGNTVNISPTLDVRRLYFYDSKSMSEDKIIDHYGTSGDSPYSRRFDWKGYGIYP